MSEKAKRFVEEIMDLLVKQYKGENRNHSNNNTILKVDINPRPALLYVSEDWIRNLSVDKNFSDLELKQITNLINKTIKQINFYELSVPGMHELMIKANSLKDLGSIILPVDLSEPMVKFVDSIIDSKIREKQTLGSEADITPYLEQTIVSLLDEQKIQFTRSELFEITNQINNKMKEINETEKRKTK